MLSQQFLHTMLTNIKVQKVVDLDFYWEVFEEEKRRKMSDLANQQRPKSIWLIV